MCQCSTAKGLNLQKGGRIIVWFGLTWNMESYNQFNARLHRQGQTKPVIIYHLVANKCKDEKVLKVLEIKDTGIGIEEKDLEIMRNPNEEILSIKPENEYNTMGTGLGLGIVKSILLVIVLYLMFIVPGK